VLIYVVWIVLLLSLFAVGVGSQALRTLNFSERLSEQLRAAYIARGALQVAALALEHDPTPAVDSMTDRWAEDPSLFLDHPLFGGSFRVTSGMTATGQPHYGLQDEERRINLNTAPEKVLERLLEAAGGLPQREASEVADAIADWRDEDTDERPHGAERFYYQSLREAYDCKDGPFENVEELLLVKGVTPEVYQKLEPWVTVYGSGRVNLNTAGAPVLRALELSEPGVAGFLLFRSGEDSVEGTSDDRQLVSIGNLQAELKAYVPAEDLARLAQLAQQQLLTVRSDAFRLQIQAQDHHSWSRMQAMGILDRKGHVKLWSER